MTPVTTLSDRTGAPEGAVRTSALWRAVCSSGAGTLAVMGMTKNTGKTVALNHLMAQAAAQRVDVGLTSIGRDGEDRDAVFAIPKPPVVVWPGTVVATARDTLQRARVRTRWLGGTGIASPMGEIGLVKALEHGEMEVAGASRGADQQRAIALLRQCGAQLVLLDGALGRSQHASPAIADAVVLATGAAIGGGIGDVIRKTRERLALLGVPAADAATAGRCANLFATGGVALWDRAGVPVFQAQIASLNAGATLLGEARGEIGMVACTGAVGRSLWQAFEMLADRHPGLQVVVADGTRLFVDAADLASLARRGARLSAWRGICVAGITLNPFSPLGGHFDAAELVVAGRAAFAGHAVADVVRESRQEFNQDPVHGSTAT